MAEDAVGNLGINFDSTSVPGSQVDLTLNAGPYLGVLDGTYPLNATAGVAAFTDLSITNTGVYTITASGLPAVVWGGLTTATSSTITITSAKPDHLFIETPPSSVATVGLPFATQPVIWVEDAYDTLVTADNTTQITAGLGSGSGPLQGNTVVTVSGGIGTFTDLADTRAETITLLFTSVPVVTSATSGDIIVSTTYTVTDKSDNPDDTGSLRYAVDNMPAGTTIDFAQNVTGTITLSNGPLDITTNVTINGPGAGTLAISGNQLSQVFDVSSGVTATIDGLTIENGAAPSSEVTGSAAQGGGIYNAGNLSLGNDSFTGNAASGSSGSGHKTGSGGAIYNTTGANLSVNGSTFTGNSAAKYGGAIYVAGGVVTLTSGTVAGNTAGVIGGGIYNNGSLTVSDSTISGNKAIANDGGGIENLGTLLLTNSTAALNSANSAAGYGGGIENYGQGTIVSTSSTIADNSAFYGGGIDNIGSTVTVANTIIAQKIVSAPADMARTLTGLSPT